MYLSFYGLKKKPFDITSDPEFLWFGEKHREAFDVLKFGLLDNKGVVLITGDVGTGKTSLLNGLLYGLRDRVIASVLSNPDLETGEFYNFLIDAYALETPYTGKQRFYVDFCRFLISSRKIGRRVLLIVDEAQKLREELMEEIRLLSNLEHRGKKLINILLFGQEEIDERIRHEALRAFRQRIGYAYHIAPLSRTETGQYITHRLKVAGLSESPFSDRAVGRVHFLSGGYPRLINLLCDQAMLTGFVRGERSISGKMVDESAVDLALHFGETVRKGKRRQLVTVLGIIGAILVAGLTIVVLATI